MKRHNHNLSHYVPTTMKMGKLYPTSCVETLPGDSIRSRVSSLVRCSPLVSPPMHPVIVRHHDFYVPNRIVFDLWDEFITQQVTEDPIVLPTFTIDSATDYRGTLLDYLGLPVGNVTTADTEILAFAIMAFNLIVNEYFIDQELQTPRDLMDITIPDIDWEKDYFTTARPDPQRGLDVMLPLGDTAPVTVTTVVNAANHATSYGQIRNTPVPALTSTSVVGAGVDADLLGTADLSSATAANVNQVRRAFAVQRILEKLSQYGNRYPEWLKSFFGVNTSDARIQRPELLNSFRSTINFSEVLQTSDLSGADAGPLGDLGGHGIVATSNAGYEKFIEEHGFIISVMSIRPVPMYQNGVHRHWLRRDPLDWFTKELELIGQQEVYDAEVYAGVGTDMETWAWTDRYREYREHPSFVTGQMRAGEQYDMWTFARNLPGASALNSEFITCDPPLLPFADQTAESDQFIVFVNNKMSAKRIVSYKPKARII